MRPFFQERVETAFFETPLPNFARWAVIDPSKISTAVQNSSKNHLFLSKKVTQN